MKAVSILIKVGEIAFFNRRFFDLIGSLVALRDLYPVTDSTHFDLADRRSLAGVDVFGADNDIELAILLDDVALANRTGDDSQSLLSPGFWPASPRDGAGLKVIGIVFGPQHTDFVGQSQHFADDRGILLNGR